MKIERLLGIIFYMINRENVNANQLANHFNVSRRTIIRDIDTLTLAGIPIYSEVGLKGGYSINPDYKLNEKIINDTDSEYILLALHSLKSIYGDQKINNTYEKIKHIYSNTNDTLPLDIDFSVINENELIVSYVSALKKAISDSNTVLFQYTNINGNKRNVKCNVIHVSYKWYSWYAFGYDLDKNDFRMFKLARIRNLEISKENFVNNYDVPMLLDKYEKNRNNGNMVVTIMYSKDIETLADEYLQGTIIKEDKTHITKNILIKENDFMIFSIILGFGDKIKIISPLSYQKKLVNHLKKTLINNYDNSDI